MTWQLAQLRHYPIDHDGQQACRTAQEQRDARFLAHDVPPIGLSDTRRGLRIAAPATVGALRVLAQTQELSKTSNAGRLGERGENWAGVPNGISYA